MRKKVIFYNRKHQKIVGLLDIPKNKKPSIVIFIHGFAGTKEYYPFVNNSIKPLLRKGFAILRIDCRGSGESDLEFKDMTIQSESEDVLTAINYVRHLRTVDSKRIALIGISVGAAAILVAMKKKPKAKTIVFLNPVIHLKDDPYLNGLDRQRSVKETGVFHVWQVFTGKEFIGGKLFFDEMAKLNIRTYMKFVKVPVLIVRGMKDRSERIEKDKEDARLLGAHYEKIAKADHNFRGKESEMRLVELITEWLLKRLK